MDKYFKRFKTEQPFIKTPPDANLNIIVVIPCYNEPDLLHTIKSLYNCKKTKKNVEVIIVINSGENISSEIVEFNRRTYETANKLIDKINSSKLIFRLVNFEKLPSKFAGVGLARKLGMDEALRRFNLLNHPEGIIVGFDADAEVDKNYLCEIEKHFENFPKTNACSIYFEHPTTGNKFTQNIYKSIISYELHLRYYIGALRYIKFPYSFHTIGSSFAVRAGIYAKQGGMNRRKAGEDFYFLQKIIPLGNYSEINTTKVIPSPRVSDRVPFGTGKAIKKMIQNNVYEYLTYNIEAFEDIKIFFEKKIVFFNQKNKNHNSKEKKELKNIPEIIRIFLENSNFIDDIKKINQNSPNIKIFEKRFFDLFNAFKIIKFLNFAHENYYKKIPAKQASYLLLKKLNIKINKLHTEKEILNIFREIDKK